MDNKERVKEPTEEMTRESLIAISYRAPEGDVPTQKSPNNKDGEKIAELPDKDEKYRSGLISISFCQPSPDVKALSGVHT